MKKGFIISIALLVLTGVIIFSLRAVTAQAESVTKIFHQRYNDRDFEYIYNEMTSKEFKKALPYAPFADFMNKMHHKFGGVKEVKRSGWGIFFKDIGLTFNLSYKIVCEKGSLQEYFTLLKDGPGWRVLIYDPRF